MAPGVVCERDGGRRRDDGETCPNVEEPRHRRHRRGTSAATWNATRVSWCIGWWSDAYGGALCVSNGAERNQKHARRPYSEASPPAIQKLTEMLNFCHRKFNLQVQASSTLKSRHVKARMSSFSLAPKPAFGCWKNGACTCKIRFRGSCLR